MFFNDLYAFRPFMDADGGGGNGGADDDKGGDDKAKDKTDVKTFTQDQVTAIASKEAKKATTSVLKSLGIDPDKFKAEDTKAVLDAKIAKDEADKTDLEKLQGTTSDKDEALAKAEAKAVLLEAKVEAMSLGVDSKKMDDFIALSNSKITDKVDLAGAMKVTLEAYPSFLKEGTADNSSGNNFDKSKANKGVKGNKDAPKNTNPVANRILNYRHK